MAITISGSRPAVARSWDPRITVRAAEGDLPGDGVDLGQLKVGYRDMPSSTPPATSSDGSAVGSDQTLAEARQGAFRWNAAFDAVTDLALLSRRSQIGAVASGHHVFLCLYDNGTGDLLASVDVTPV